MSDPKPDQSPEEIPGEQPAFAGADHVHAALIDRLSQIQAVAPRVKPAQSLQPTPEAAKSSLARLRRKQRMLFQESQRAQQAKIPPAPDPLSP
jgi:hypothetical protein